MTLVFAHRGVHHVARENTLDAFVAARSLGVDGVELDVRRTRDGDLVVHHDPVVDGHVIASSRRRELPAHVAGLREAMAVLEGVTVNVELKEDPAHDDAAALAFVPHVLATIYDLAREDEVVFSSFGLDLCVRLHDSDPSVAVGWLVDADPDVALTQAHRLGLAALHPHVSLVDAALVTRARALGVALRVWTPSSEAELRAMARLGVAAVITDEPDLARAVLAEAAPPTDR